MARNRCRPGLGGPDHRPVAVALRVRAEANEPDLSTRTAGFDAVPPAGGTSAHRNPHPPPFAVAPVVRQPLGVALPSREVRVLEECLYQPEPAILPTDPVSRVLPPVAKLLNHLLPLDHLRSF